DRIETRVTHQKANPALAHKALLADGSEALHSHTAHMSIIDDSGMAVAYTSTIEQWFGSGIAVARHGFLLNNELTDFSAEPGKPNSPAAGKRPRSNMSPLLLFEGSKPVGVVGCAGGGRIPTIIVEMLENYYIHKMTLREAMAFPRFHPNEGKLEVDPSYPTSLPAKLKEAGYDVSIEKVGATPHAMIRRTAADAWEAAAEPRADGMALLVEPLGRKK
ncbi:MAG: gamma-glutamyltransferase, partial [Deltaproteobacteria bacterium]|nr:gamma-glutamyltransferase [Deltaproteobacteria bacterium]